VWLAAFLVAYLVGISLIPGYGWAERDWDRDGRTTIGEFLRGADVGTRSVVRAGEACREYFYYKDGRPIRYDCPSGRFSGEH
jgi:hypothetical protein